MVTAPTNNDDASTTATAADHSHVHDAAAHPVSAVTVFRVDRAEVVRVVSVRLRPGLNTVAVQHLPSCLDENSIRVDGGSGSGTGTTTILDVVYTPPPLPAATPPKPPAETSAVLAGLAKKRDALLAEKSALETQLHVVTGYAKAIQPDHSDGAGLFKFLDSFMERRRAVYDAIVALNDEIDEVQARIREATPAKAVDEFKLRAVAVTISVHAENECDAEIRLSYAVSGASWTPLYDLRALLSGETAGASSPSGGDSLEEDKGPAAPKHKAAAAAASADRHRVLLHYRASVSQRTGEPWDNVALTLSAASPQIGSAVPTLSPLMVRETPHFAARPSGFSSRAPSSAYRKTASVQEEVDEATERLRGSIERIMSRGEKLESLEYQSAPLEFRSRGTAVVHNSVTASFVIRGLSTIPSDSDSEAKSQSHKVSVAELAFDNVDLEWVTVPKALATVFLQCKVKNTSDYPLLPGQSSVFFGNSFVAKSSIPLVAPHESFSVSLGEDSAVRVTYHPRIKRLLQPTSALFTASISTTYYSQGITVHNARLTPLRRLVVRDQLPVSADAKIKVNVLAPAEMPVGPDSWMGATVRDGVRARYAQKNDESPSDGDAGNGIVEWLCANVAPAAVFDLTLAWEISAPLEMHWSIQL
ncbi:hypothetical protein DFJ73DRAFT_838265 [Zopfochytrium polystomum]|nr:hypothetical protein DFJ73DRAFT_838265 [Zopfochytrium polystomum]